MRRIGLHTAPLLMSVLMQVRRRAVAVHSNQRDLKEIRNLYKHAGSGRGG